MSVEKIPLISHIYTNKLLVDFLDQKQELSSLHNGHSFDRLDQGFLDKKDIDVKKRNLLVNVLSSQYENIGLPVPDNVLQLSKKGTYTITTGHQLCLFSGPQYFIHKIISILKSAIDLNKKYPNAHFVPLFWMASEDHDFEEISSVKVFGKGIDIDKSYNKAVGTLDSSVFSSALQELKELLNNDEKANEIVQLFEQAFTKGSWSNVTRFYLHHLFKEYGLVILDANDKNLKNSFKSVLSKEIKEKFIFNSVLDTNTILREKSYKPSINPRELNLFYLNENSRDRIISSNGTFSIGENKWSLKQLDDLIDQQAELFSPNVLMRPIYQEFLLPNVAYIGGPSELTYWLQLKKAFDSIKLEFPLLILRDHFGWIDSKSYDWWEEQGFSFEDLFKPYDNLVKINLSKDDTFDLSNAKEIFTQLVVSFKNTTVSIDSSVEQSINASLRNMEKEFVRIENKLLKAFKIKNQQKLGKIQKIQSKVINNGILNERTDNFIAPFLNYKGNYIEKLIDTSQVDDYSLKIIRY